MTDIEIAKNVKLENIENIAKKAGIEPEDIECYGKYKAKISDKIFEKVKKQENGKLVLVTAISPTPLGEGKTTISIAIADGLQKIGKKSMLCLREPSLGPVFGIKGGATGGGHSQVAPMEDINLHFTGDIHAITSANNLLSAMIDNHIYFGNELKFKKVVWKRCVDLNDRQLRTVNTGLSGESKIVQREDHFDITVASEIMAIVCLSKDIFELREKLGNIIVGYNEEDKPIYAKDLKAQGAMAVLLKDAIKPNLVQTLEHTPALIHGGPFANIAHGCNSIRATKLALKLSDYTITESGFGADLGAEKFLDIKCKKFGIKPDAVVLVTTIKALKYHGGVEKENIQKENIEAISEEENEGADVPVSDSKIKFSINNSLRDYGEWYGHFHTSDDKYEGPISIYRSENGEYIVCMNYRNGDQKDSAVLGVVKLGDSGQNIQNIKYITRSIDKMIEAMYEKTDFRYKNLSGYLRESLENLQDRFNMDFTEEGKKILLNSEKKFIYTDKTTTLEKDKNECVLGYKQLDELRNYNAFQIPNSENSYEGQTTITVPVSKCNTEKISEEQKKAIISQLKGLYKSSSKLGMFNGTENDSVEQYRKLLTDLRKNKI